MFSGVVTFRDGNGYTVQRPRGCHTTLGDTIIPPVRSYGSPPRTDDLTRPPAMATAKKKRKKIRYLDCLARAAIDIFYSVLAKPTSTQPINYYVRNDLFTHRQAFLLWPWVFSRALGRGSCRGPACTHGSSLGPGRSPWHVFWAFQVAQSGK